MVIVFRHFEHAGAGNIAAAQHVFEKGDDVLATLRTTE
jgi:hypothetical protein